MWLGVSRQWHLPAESRPYAAAWRDVQFQTGGLQVFFRGCRLCLSLLCGLRHTSLCMCHFMLELASKLSRHLSHCAAAQCVGMMDDVQALHAVVVQCKISSTSHCMQHGCPLHVQSRQSAYLVSACAEVITAAGWCLTRCTCCSPLAMSQQRRQNAWILLSATSVFALCAAYWKPVASFSTRALPRNAWTDFWPSTSAICWPSHLYPLMLNLMCRYALTGLPARDTANHVSIRQSEA